MRKDGFGVGNGVGRGEGGGGRGDPGGCPPEYLIISIN